MYNMRWKEVVNGIGKEWFKRPFGAYLHMYFTQHVPLWVDTVEQNALTDRWRIHPAVIPPHVPLSEHQSPVIQGMIQMARHYVTYTQRRQREVNALPLPAPRFLQVNLWTKNETEWIHHEEIKNLLQEMPIVYELLNGAVI